MDNNLPIVKSLAMLTNFRIKIFDSAVLLTGVHVVLDKANSLILKLISKEQQKFDLRSLSKELML